MDTDQPIETEQPGADDVARQGAAHGAEEEAAEASETSSTERFQEELERLSAELGEAERRLAESDDRYLRLRAEFDNFRRRTRQEVDDIRSRAAETLAAALLPIVDNLERALASAATAKDVDSLAEGVEMVHRQLLQELAKVGVQPIDAAGKPFDPNFHEAVAEVESDEHAGGTVVLELQKGYMINDKVLRFSMVHVATGRGAEGGEDR